VGSRRRIRPDVSLVGDVDAEARFERFPSYFTAKGMFFARMVDLGGEEVWRTVEPTLKKRPALGRYLPFSDYPQEDFSRLAHAVAVQREPRRDVVEAMRRLGRVDIETFATSKLGSVVFALVAGNVTAALLKLPDMYRMSLKGGEVEASLDARDVVTLRFKDFFGWLDCYPVGQIEGLVSYYDRRAEVEVELETETSGLYRVHLEG
jgi:uncharacterized protein (TIGR02265 family)